MPVTRGRIHSPLCESRVRWVILGATGWAGAAIVVTLDDAVYRAAGRSSQSAAARSSTKFTQQPRRLVDFSTQSAVDRTLGKGRATQTRLRNEVVGEEGDASTREARPRSLWGLKASARRSIDQALNLAPQLAAELAN